MTRKTLLLLSIIAAMTATVLVCQGRVFFRWGSAAESLHTMESLGGKLAYQATVNVNGGGGQLAVFGFNRPIIQIVNDLARAFNIAHFSYAGGSMGCASVSTNGQTLRWVVLDMGSESQTLAFLIEQSDEDSRRSARPPEGQMLAAVPAYPDSKPVFFASDDNAGMSLAVSRASSNEEDVRQSMDNALIHDGWNPALPAAVGKGGPPGMKVYFKQQQICCVLVDTAEESGESRITILHKRRGMK